MFQRDYRHWHFKHWILAAAAVALSADVLHAALPTDSDTSGRTSFAGQLLIAAPALQGSPFDRTVILMAQHSHEGDTEAAPEGCSPTRVNSKTLLRICPFVAK